MDKYFEVWKKSFILEGRSPRSEYWIFQLVNFVIFLVLMSLFVLFKDNPNIQWFMYILIVLFAISVIPANISVTVRRLHDINLSGWWFFLGFIPYGIGAIIIVILALTKGTEGENKYGPDPLMN